MKKFSLVLFTLILVFNSLSSFAYPIKDELHIYVNVKDFGAIGDGSTDDSKAIKDAAAKAYTESKVLYFPTGTYVLSETIKFSFDNSKVLTLQGGIDATIVTPDSFEGDMFVSDMEYNFNIKDLKFIHNGKQGQILRTHYLNVVNSSFESTEQNRSTLVTFAGSNCRVIECTFNTKNEFAYALDYLRQPNKISINDYITDNTFTGVGNGVRIGALSMDGRPEGLKINGNIFENSGSRQIEVESILHLDISDNTFKNCSGTAIGVSPKELGVHGLFVTGNNIQAKESAIEVFNAGAAVIHIGDNYINNTGIGVRMTKGFGDVHINNNLFKDISEVAIRLDNAYEIFITENVIKDSKESMYITGKKGNFVIEDNEYTKKANINIEGYSYKDPSTSVNIYVVLSIVFAVIIVVLLAILIALLRKK